MDNQATFGYPSDFAYPQRNYYLSPETSPYGLPDHNAASVQLNPSSLYQTGPPQPATAVEPFVPLYNSYDLNSSISTSEYATSDDATVKPYSNGTSPVSLPTPIVLTDKPLPPRRQNIQRALQACDNCRLKKSKCDEERPACSACRSSGIPCVYQQKPMVLKDSLLSRLSGNVDSLMAVVTNMATQLEQLTAGQQTPSSQNTSAASKPSRRWLPIKTGVPSSYNSRFVLKEEIDRESLFELYRNWNEDADRGSLSPVGSSSDSVASASDCSIPMLVASFVKNVHVLYPFISPEVLIHLIDKNQSQTTSEDDSSGSPKKHRRQSTNSDAKTLKRKREAALMQSSNKANSASPDIVQNNAASEAVQLLIFALGEACQQSGHPSSRKQSIDETSSLSFTRSGQIEKFAGLKNYIYATTILGQQMGHTNLIHIQALLLAGLYAAIVVRPVESWRWIQTAGIAMRLYLTSNPKYLNPAFDAAGVDLVRLTFWTCFQLESDILAELDLPSSELSIFEEKMPMPKTLALARHSKRLGFDPQKTMFFFVKQTQLRKILNESRSASSESLDSWRNSLPPAVDWTESQPLSNDINQARMMARYYEAEHVLNEQHLQRVMQHMEGKTPSPTPTKALPHDTDENPSNLQLYAVTLGLPYDALQGAKRSINAAVKHADALHSLEGVAGHKVSTNRFLSAQAQIHNVFVLAAVSRAEHLSWLIPRGDLQRVISHTIAALENIIDLSPSMEMGLLAVRSVWQTLFEETTDDDDDDEVTDDDKDRYHYMWQGPGEKRPGNSMASRA